MEGLCFELRVLLSAVDRAFETTSTSLITVGGGARNDVWQQIKADVTGVTVEIPDVEDATAHGAALIAAVGVGVFADLAEASRSAFRLKKRIEPLSEMTDYYNAVFQEYLTLYPALREINARMSGRAVKQGD